MDADHFSDMLDLVEVRGVVSGGFAAQGRWVSRGALGIPLKFFAVVSGSARLTTDGVDGPVELEAGDVALLNDRAWLELEGGSGDGPRREIVPEEDDPATRLTGAALAAGADVLVGGRVDLEPAGQELVLRALPPVAHVRGAAGEGARLRATLHRLFDEVAGRRLGFEFAVRQHAQLLLLEVLRASVRQADLPPGWLKLLADERLRPALAVLHGDPGRQWGLPDLADAAAMSRTSFAQRFRAVAGVPPLAYLNRWRMLLAQRALRERDVRVGALAAELGYGSESAFSTAFKRQVGESPLRYRYRVLDTSRAVVPE